MSEPPLLGVAGHWGSAEISLARRFNDLHQLIYTRGGIRPSNAAVEEVAKLALIRLYSLGHPSADLGSSVRAGDLFRPGVGAEAFASAFAKALGQRAKTDPIDARVIAHFAEATKRCGSSAPRSRLAARTIRAPLR